jgi:teichuronic acid exporter
LSLRQKTITGLSWSFVDTSFNQVFQFVTGIILARLLTPTEFGLVGMLAIFFAISTSFIDSGFGDALIRKKNCSEDDYNTVFYFNLLVGFTFFLLFYFSAPLIADFFSEPQLIDILKVLSITPIITSLGIVQSADLVKKVDLKTRTKISVISNIISGTAAILMAYNGFGVWSLVARQFLMNLAGTSAIWFFNRWMPKIRFSKKSFKGLFSFGSKMFASGMLNTVFDNIYYLVIGKFFSAQALGYYTRAVSFANLPSSSINNVILRVSFPVLASIQDDTPRLKEAHRKLIKNTMLITFIMMLGLAAMAEPLILTLIGEKWLPSVQLLQLVCFALMLYPLHSLNLNILTIKGRSGLYLKLELIKKILVLPVIGLGIFYSIELMIIGMALHSLVTFFIIIGYSGKILSYSPSEHITDIFPAFILGLVNGSVIYLADSLLNLEPLLMLIIQISASLLIIISICELTKMESYIEIKEIILSRLSSLLRK